MQNRYQKIWKVAGFVSLIPLAFIVVAVVIESIPLEPLLLIGIALSLIISLIFTYIGTKLKFKWMLAWVISFLLLLPLSNILFWALQNGHMKKTMWSD